jgi:hypothetical protein
MLRIEHQRAGSREVESGGDSPVCRSQRSNPGLKSAGLKCGDRIPITVADTIDGE